MFRKRAGRLRIDHELESLIITLAEDNPSWGYDRIAGALSNLGYDVSDQPVGNILKKNGIPPVTTAIASNECIFGEVCTFNKRGVFK